jgi:hypothetical protein
MNDQKTELSESQSTADMFKQTKEDQARGIHLRLDGLEIKVATVLGDLNGLAGVNRSRHLSLAITDFEYSLHALSYMRSEKSILFPRPADMENVTGVVEEDLKGMLLGHYLADLLESAKVYVENIRPSSHIEFIAQNTFTSRIMTGILWFEAWAKSVTNKSNG